MRVYRNWFLFSGLSLHLQIRCDATTSGQRQPTTAATARSSVPQVRNMKDSLLQPGRADQSDTRKSRPCSWTSARVYTFAK
ncbi:hypothetical protein CBOM_08102 [Ceraceosorus bombacis]|uniref:Secreted protein n=1 Tax=Ceraceosorus bombacis TaxID=401625 RepID=A0A0P1BLB5_9BASI|nr:hypothetical protein CBOM_08102 [Ceraceosorus bombacis]